MHSTVFDRKLTDYYSKRAEEYDSVYTRSDPIRLREQDFIKGLIQKLFRNRYVLELACGTGYWTESLLGSAEKVLATDSSLEMLSRAAIRCSDASIQFLQADAYNPPVCLPQFTGAMAHFWFSHIPLHRIHLFLDAFHSRLARKSPIMLSDNVYRKELGGKLIHKIGDQNTYKRRVLQTAKQYDILKNYYTKNQLEKIFSRYSKQVKILYLTHFWVLHYTYGT